MSTMTSLDPHDAYKRAYDVDMLQHQMYGAVMSAYMFRRDNDKLTNVEMARRGGWTRSQVSKLLAAPQNWTLKTVAELCNILDLRFQFILEDRTEAHRGFNAHGFVAVRGANAAHRSAQRPSRRVRAPLTSIEASFNRIGSDQNAVSVEMFADQYLGPKIEQMVG